MSQMNSKKIAQCDAPHHFESLMPRGAHGDRVASDVLSALVMKGFLVSDSPYGMVRFGIPRARVAFLLSEPVGRGRTGCRVGDVGAAPSVASNAGGTSEQAHRAKILTMVARHAH